MGQGPVSTLAVHASHRPETCAAACVCVPLMGPGPQSAHDIVLHSSTVDDHCGLVPVVARRSRSCCVLVGFGDPQPVSHASSVPVQRGSHSTAWRSSTRQPGSALFNLVDRPGCSRDELLQQRHPAGREKLCRAAVFVCCCRRGGVTPAAPSQHTDPSVLTAEVRASGETLASWAAF